jgi:hypothetical protein
MNGNWKACPPILGGEKYTAKLIEICQKYINLMIQIVKGISIYSAL